MARFDINNIDDMHFDILREIGNIGSGNAATALSQMIDTSINMSVPKVDVLDFYELPDILGGAESIVVGLMFTFDGDIDGMMMLVTSRRTAHYLVNQLMRQSNEDLDEEKEFSEMEISALRELGNILSGAYLSSFSMLTNLKIVPSIPYHAIDMAGAILSVPAIELGKVGDKALMIGARFGKEEEKISGYFLLIPTLDSYDTIMKSLGIS